MPLIDAADAVYLGATAADRLYLGASEAWSPSPGGGPVEGPLPTFVAANAARIASDAGTALTINTPTGTQDGDLLVAFVAPMSSASPATTVTPPAGWTERLWVAPTTGSQPGMGCWTKLASAEAAQQTFTLSRAIQTGMTLAAYRGATFDVAGPTTGGYNATGVITVKGVTATSNNSLWVAGVAVSTWGVTITDGSSGGWSSRATTTNPIRTRTATKAISLGAVADDVGSFVGSTSGDNFVSASVVLGPIAA